MDLLSIEESEEEDVQDSFCKDNESDATQFYRLKIQIHIKCKKIIILLHHLSLRKFPY